MTEQAGWHSGVAPYECAPRYGLTMTGPTPQPSPQPSAHKMYEGAGELLRALAAPLRIAIVTELGDGPRCVHELVDALQAPQPLVSQHLRVLRGAGVVRGQRRGREIAYFLTDEHIAHIVADAVSHAGEVASGPRPAATVEAPTPPRHEVH